MKNKEKLEDNDVHDFEYEKINFGIDFDMDYYFSSKLRFDTGINIDYNIEKDGIKFRGMTVNYYYDSYNYDSDFEKRNIEEISIRYGAGLTYLSKN